MEKTKYIIIESYGPISTLGGISGPIKTPFKLEVSKIVKLICERKVVYEVNPLNKNEKIRLTRNNISKNNFTAKLNTTKPVISEPQIEDPPEQTNTETVIKKNPVIDVFIANRRS